MDILWQNALAAHIYNILVDGLGIHLDAFFHMFHKLAVTALPAQSWSYWLKVEVLVT